MAEEINFDSLNIPISENIKKYSIEQQKEIYEYLCSLDDLGKTAYFIAFDHLKSSFNIIRSNGFKEWKVNKSKQQI